MCYNHKFIIAKIIATSRERKGAVLINTCSHIYYMTRVHENFM